jgi:preprotein translocase subunit SecA
MKKFISQIKLEKKNLQLLTEDELKESIQHVRLRFKEYLKSVGDVSFLPNNDLIASWFACVQEVSTRTIGLSHFDTQLAAGLLLHEGKIVEMKTGEGKTLSSTLPISLNALGQKGVHVVTVNEYLAERDQKWMGKIYQGLGLTSGLVKGTSSLLEKKKSYYSDITYVTNSELVFDYLRDSSAYNINEIVQRPFQYCILDEIDSILIDEARTPLILSTTKGIANLNKLSLAKKIISFLKKDIDFEVDEKRRDINLTDKGYQEVTILLSKETLYDSDDPWILEILNALKAQYIFKRNKDYVILNNKICIVDESTGRTMEDRRWSMGLHEAVEVKETLTVGGETKTKSSITYQNFFTLYPKLAGMTGTGKTAEKEFQDIYGLEVLVVPTFKPMIRKDLSDFVYQNELAKWKAVLNQSKECYEKGQPLLIGTASVEKSEFLSDLFKASKLPHQVLNAKPENIFRESEIIAQAGERYAITIATNMAGRGTDIILGGNIVFQVKQLLLEIFFEKEKKENTNFQEFEMFVTDVSKEYKTLQQQKKLNADILNLPYSLDNSSNSLKLFYNFLYQKLFEVWKTENSLVKELGGLFVLGTERHETRRIDNQLRGRAGRQGDPGVSQFFVSLDDELIKIFGGDNIRRWVEYLLEDKNLPLESDMLTKSLEDAQEKVELYNYDVRKNVFQYDNVLNKQRKKIYKARQEILLQNNSNSFFLRYLESQLNKILENLSSPSLVLISELEQASLIEELSFVKGNQQKKEKEFGQHAFSLDRFLTSSSDSYSEIWISHDLNFASSDIYQTGLLHNSYAINNLTILDFHWIEHLERMNYIRETINWRSYGQQNPLTEYKIEADKSYLFMFEKIRVDMLYSFLNNLTNTLT